MFDMPRPLPKYIYFERTRHGKVVFYFRIGKGPRVRMPNPADPGFLNAYQGALLGIEAPKPVKYGVHTLHWLLTQYRASSAYQGLSRSTRKQRDNIFKHVLEKAGDKPYRSITQRDIINGRERRKATPFQAKNFLTAMRGLFRWALESQLVERDPTEKVKDPKKPNTGGFPVWTDAEIERYQAHWPIGTHQRVWFDLALHTGLRRGDLVVLGRQHVKDGVATIATEKTGMEVYIPLPDDLLHTLNAGPTGDLHFIVGERGKPFAKESFANQFKKACKSAGINKSLHGLRKASATKAAEAGATVAELEARYGWEGGSMASLYTRSANRKALAMAAGEKMANKVSPHPKHVSPHLKKRIGKSDA